MVGWVGVCPDRTSGRFFSFSLFGILHMYSVEFLHTWKKMYQYHLFVIAICMRYEMQICDTILISQQMDDVRIKFIVLC